MEIGGDGRYRPFLRICERMEFAVRFPPDLAASCCYRVGGALVLLVAPQDAGAAEREIAYRIGLAVIGELGEDRYVRTLAALFAGEHRGYRLPPALPAPTDLGADVAAD